MHRIELGDLIYNNKHNHLWTNKVPHKTRHVMLRMAGLLVTLIVAWWFIYYHIRIMY